MFHQDFRSGMNEQGYLFNNYYSNHEIYESIKKAK